MKGAEERGLKISPATDFDTVPGKGVTGSVDGRRVAVGNTALFASLGIEPADLPVRADALRQEGQGVMLIAVGGKPAGLIAVADPIKDSAVTALKALHAEHIHVVMLTGDTLSGLAAIAAVFIECLPYQDISSSTILLLEQFSGHQSENVRAAVVEVAAGLLEEYDGKPIFRPRLEALARPEQHSSSDSHGA